MNVISIGEVLWDIVGPTAHLGGAAFNFSAHLCKLGHTVSFISGVGSDPRGQRILEQMVELGLSSRYISRIKEHPTGIASVTLDRTGQPAFVIKRPAAYDFPQLSEAEFEELQNQQAEWLYYGTLQQMSSTARQLTKNLLDFGCAKRNFYDLNLRKDSYEPSLVEELMSRASVVKLNDSEVEEVVRLFGDSPRPLEDFCRRYSQKFNWEAVCVTRGANGCAILMNGEYVLSPGYRVEVVDTVGAGDAFAAAFVHGFGKGWPAQQIGDFANRVGALIASRRGAVPSWTFGEVKAG